MAAFLKAEVRLRTRLTCPAGHTDAMKPNPADNPENKYTKEQKGTEEHAKEHSFFTKGKPHFNASSPAIQQSAPIRPLMKITKRTQSQNAKPQ